jgi:hypothetical protein
VIDLLDSQQENTKKEFEKQSTNVIAQLVEQVIILYSFLVVVVVVVFVIVLSRIKKLN